VTLDINDLDEIAPSITSGDTAVAINENTGADTVIYTATADDSLDISAGVTFSLTGDSDPTLSIDPITGAVTLSADADYETQSQYSFAVIATDAADNESDAQSVTLDINNLDEVAPIVTSGDTASAIDENTGAGQVVYTAIADDSLDISAGVTFSLSGIDAAAFTINEDSGEVTLVADPDHETQSQYSFAVIATDAAGNVSDAQSVILDINNLDEVAPSITSGDTAVAIDENTGADTVIYTAIADDSLDTSDGVTFSLSFDSDPALSIDPSTGAVTLSADADYEVQSVYSFTVVASDGVNGDVEQSVTLDINNLDEVAPTITSDYSAGSIDENTGADTVIYTAIADDSLDTSDGVIFSLSLDSDPALSIDPSTGAVTLSADADYEIQSVYSFTVVAYDGVNEAVEQSVTLDINNLDEIAPTITSSVTADAIDENISSYRVVYTATADDSFDTSDGVSFSLSFDSDPALYIDSQTGEVTLMDNPDYESQDFYSFYVIATDAAGNESEQYVTLDINNLDEIAPSITSGDTAVAINENTGADQIVYTATADDSLDISAGVTFSLTDDSDPALSIDPSTGAVTLSADADYETQSQYSFTVVASDGVNGDVEQSVTLDINNLDEVAPSITSGDTAVAIDENTGAGQVVYTAIADDSLDISAGVTFSLSGIDAAAFTINEDSGEVTLVADADYETQSQYSFTIVASDGVNGDVEQSVTLDINNLDEVAPSITSGDTAVAIDENTGAGQVVYTAIADDSLDISAGVTFSLSGIDAAAFTINEDSGEVTLIADADYETQSVYSFTIVASDGVNADVEQSVTLDINNLDEIAPTLTSGATATAINENTGADTVIYTAIADDSLDISAGVTFSLSGIDAAAFTINEDSGEVTLIADADYETQSVYSFTIVASDGVNADVEQSVTLDINNLDEIAPTLTSGATATAINENTGADTVIYTAIADDSLDISAGVTFSLTGDSDPALSMDSLTGEVTLSADADYETQSQYSFTVVASDGVNGDVEQSVTLDINDLDEVAPSITSGDTAVAINENTGADTVIYTAIADDSLDISAGVTFSLTGDSDPTLSIDPSTGEVTLSADADYETQSQYSFTVVASDGVNGDVEQSVTLDINDLDEVAPSITSGDTAVAINENTGADTVIYTAIADDSLDISAGVTFSLTGDSDPALSMDSLTGEVTLSADADYETQSQYSFTVVASDGVNGDVEQSVTLDINDLDEVAPSITSGDTAVAINENTGADTVIYTAIADDSLDISAGVTFSLTGDSDPALSMDSLTGEVTLSADADYETQSQYSFTVVASDGVNGDVEQSVTLDINNLDEIAPSITSGDTAVAINENTGADTVIYTAIADDSLDISAGVTFSLTGDSDPALSMDSFNW
jgi:nucleoid-associated protein YgaU